MEKYFKEIKYEENMVNPTSQIIDLWMKRTVVSGKYGLEHFLDEPKGKKEWGRQMISKIKPSGLAVDILNAISGVEEEKKKLREDDTYFSDYVKRRVVELDRRFV